MALNATGLNSAVQGVATAYPYLQLHTGTPATDGSTLASAAARVAASWVVAGAVATSSGKSFTGGAASGPCTYVSFWSALTGGTCGGTQALTGDQTFNAAGAYTVNTATITGS